MCLVIRSLRVYLHWCSSVYLSSRFKAFFHCSLLTSSRHSTLTWSHFSSDTLRPSTCGTLLLAIVNRGLHRVSYRTIRTRLRSRARHYGLFKRGSRATREKLRVPEHSTSRCRWRVFFCVENVLLPCTKSSAYNFSVLNIDN